MGLYECVCLNWESKGGKGGVLSSYLVPRGKEVSFHFTEKEKRGKGIHTKGITGRYKYGYKHPKRRLQRGCQNIYGKDIGHRKKNHINERMKTMK